MRERAFTILVEVDVEKAGARGSAGDVTCSGRGGFSQDLFEERLPVYRTGGRGLLDLESAILAAVG